MLWNPNSTTDSAFNNADLMIIKSERDLLPMYVALVLATANRRIDASMHGGPFRSLPLPSRF